ncbi:MAG: alpha-hydroxy-acid oxidizing protein [Chloroflexi bacterium]|nr:alpha-hydroxy-acid oxidizing protein [Chloroflexota bacterium]
MLITIDDLRRRARQRLPRAVFDFIDGGAEDELTLRRNRSAFEQITFRPRVLIDTSHRDQSTTVLGQTLSTPLILAPTGLCGMAAPRGEVLAARASLNAGVIFTLSSLSAVTIEETARAAPGPHWFQLYVWRDRELTRSLVERAASVGYRTMVVTVDVPVLGQRERDVRNGATIPPRVTLRNALNSVQKLGWLLAMARNPRIDFVNVASPNRARGAFALGPFVNSQFDPSVSWADLAWFRSIWSGPLVLKGIMSAEDARRAVEYGVDAIVVSNHGGRQLDGLPAAIEVLPEVAAAVGNRVEVLFDGGIRRGTDVVKALALGARACLIGRPYLYGLGAAGQPGIELSIALIRAEIDRAQALLGRPTLADLDRRTVRLPASWLSD